MSDSVKRFVAGAVCPKCATMDVLVVYRKDDKEFRECVECGFIDEMNFKPQAKELTTRVNKSEEEIKQETQVLNILDPAKNRK